MSTNSLAKVENALKNTINEVKEHEKCIKQLKVKCQSLLEEKFKEKWGIEKGNIIDFRGRKFKYLGANTDYFDTFYADDAINVRGINKNGSLSKRLSRRYLLWKGDKLVKLYNSYEEFQEQLKEDNK